MRIISYFFILVVIILGMTFATLNSESVTIDYYLSQSTLPLSLLLVIVFALGCLVGMVSAVWFLVKAKIINYRLRQRLSAAEKAIDVLKAKPVQGRAE